MPSINAVWCHLYRRGYINADQRLVASGLPLGRSREPKDGQRYRYSARYDEPWQTDKRYLKGYITSNLVSPFPSQTPPAMRSPSNHVIPEERALWVASSTVKVLDLSTNEVLGEMTRYAMSYIHAPRHSMPWLNHSICPQMNVTGYLDSTRKFVDEILIPKEK